MPAKQYPKKQLYITEYERLTVAALCKQLHERYPDGGYMQKEKGGDELVPNYSALFRYLLRNGQKLIPEQTGL